MTLHTTRSVDTLPGEQLLFAIRGSVKKRIVTAAVFAFFILVTFWGIFVLRSITVSMLGIGAMILSFWPLTDAYVPVEVTNLRIKYSEFSKRTAKTEDIPLGTLASCSGTKDKRNIELLFVIGDSEAVQSIRCLTFSKADENVMLLTQLPCPRQEDLKQILESRYI